MIKKNTYLFLATLLIMSDSIGAKPFSPISFESESTKKWIRNNSGYLLGLGALSVMAIGVINRWWNSSPADQKQSQKATVNASNAEENGKKPLKIPQVFKLASNSDQSAAFKNLNNHLIPSKQLKELSLCPLFTNLTEKQSPLLRIMSNDKKKVTGGIIDKKLVNTIPCTYSYEKNGKTQTIIQLPVINQANLNSENGFEESGNNCPVLALYNSYCLYKFYKDGKIDHLKQLTSIEKAADFYKKLKNPAPTMDAETLKELVEDTEDTEGLDKDFHSKVTVLETLPYEELLDEHKVLEKDWWKNQKSNIFRSFIIQTSDELNGIEQNFRSHWYTLAILKRATDIQYVVMDSIPDAHLCQEIEYTNNETNPPVIKKLKDKSYGLNRLLFIIDLLENGRTDISRNEWLENSLPEDKKPTWMGAFLSWIYGKVAGRKGEANEKN